MESQSVNDKLFLRHLMEYEFLMEIYRGDIESALRMSEDIRKHATLNN